MLHVRSCTSWSKCPSHCDRSRRDSRECVESASTGFALHTAGRRVCQLPSHAVVGFSENGRTVAIRRALGRAPTIDRHRCVRRVAEPSACVFRSVLEDGPRDPFGREIERFRSSWVPVRFWPRLWEELEDYATDTQHHDPWSDSEQEDADVADGAAA